MTSEVRNIEGTRSYLNLGRSIEDIKTILNDIHVPVVKASAQEAIELKEKYKVRLNEAYHLVVDKLTHRNVSERSQNLLLLGDVMTKFGRLRYDEKNGYPSCMVMMRGSLNAQLVAIGVFDTLSFDIEKLDNLSQFEEVLFQHNKFSSFDDFITGSNTGAVVGAIAGKNLTPENLIKMGFTLSWLANGLYNTKGFSTEEENKETETLNCQRFDRVCDLGEKILLMANNERANLERAEIYYNAFSRIELM